MNKFVLVIHKSTFVVEASQKYDIGNWYSDLPYQIGKCLSMKSSCLAPIRGQMWVGVLNNAIIMTNIDFKLEKQR